jgi:DNA-binding response OmpR family regulator
VRAILRRRRLEARRARAVRRIGDLEIDFARHRVAVAGEPVRLTPSEFRLLAILAREPGRPLRPAEILSRLWETEHVGSGGACRTHISNLRKKIDPDPVRPHRIVTVPRMGYLLRTSGNLNTDGPGRRPMVAPGPRARGRHDG